MSSYIPKTDILKSARIKLTRAFSSEDVELTEFDSSHSISRPLIPATFEDRSVRVDEATRNSIPNGDLSDSSKDRRPTNPLFDGWKFTAFLAFIASVLVLLFNIGFLLFMGIRRSQGRPDTFSEGSCENVHRLSIGFHWLINTLSTILLGASNFGMQCLAAPTRENLDRAHRRGWWLDVGVPSFRNLFHIAHHRTFLWFCLSFSSIPFHLFYNSSVFYKTAVPAYHVYLGPGSLSQMDWSDVNLANHQFRSSVSSTTENSNENYFNQRDSRNQSSLFRQFFDRARNGDLIRLKNADCVDAFAKTYQTTYANLLLAVEYSYQNSYAIVDVQEVFQPSMSQYGVMPAYKWLCPSDSGSQAICQQEGTSAVKTRAQDSNWNVSVQEDFLPREDEDDFLLRRKSGFKVLYCLAEPMPQHCSLQYSFPLMIATVSCNLLKVLVLMYIWLGIREAPILTIGDAIVSFLRRPDPYSRGMCLPPDGSATYLRPFRPLPSGFHYRHLERLPVAYIGKRMRWGSGVSTRWTFVLFFWIIAILSGIALLTLSLLRGGNLSQSSLGAVDSQMMINPEKVGGSLVTTSFIANLPQLIFSLLYVGFNSLLTGMCVSAEWSGYSKSRKGLRVSHKPRLAQRSNYFLSIPYKYAIPLLVCSSILHWLASQALFIIAVEAYDTAKQRAPSLDVYTCGYSSLAVVIALAVGVTMFLCLILLSFRRLQSAMPIASSCSLAISAACHPMYDPNEDKEEKESEEVESECEEDDIAYRPVQWGSIPVSGPVGHCSFTSVDVDDPEEGKEYQ